MPCAHAMCSAETDDLTDADMEKEATPKTEEQREFLTEAIKKIELFERCAEEVCGGGKVGKA